MVSPRAAWPGHSLPELLVALTFLAVTLAGMTSSAVLASRWTAEAVLRQRALSAAEAALDSLAALPDRPTAGARADADPPWLLSWEVEPVAAATGRAAVGAAWLRVTVTLSGAVLPAAQLRGVWMALPPGPLP
jgi:Tfp pilus assembly protein PilV